MYCFPLAFICGFHFTSKTFYNNAVAYLKALPFGIFLTGLIIKIIFIYQKQTNHHLYFFFYCLMCYIQLFNRSGVHFGIGQSIYFHLAHLLPSYE